MAQIEILLHPRQTRECFEKESLVALAGVKDITISLPVEQQQQSCLPTNNLPHTVVGNEWVLEY
ncbi:hypothetical protein CY34DRAFT_801867 [Suillus luteus UH-Slu-Lm8-n1]|uniref:Uncharacterized protein n=1 Tax=Suillus luteus UH-Slu-Lm8-n1 TaxID=930992 RepID=A0A0D0BQ54_9AGAM|nr:hypothetical protein CY34DRAFT_801867 [Suillus luteus UH-Slu-Lm8-n1]